MNTLKSFKNSPIFKGKNPLASAIFAGVVIGICLVGTAMPQVTCADFANATNASYVARATNDSLKRAVRTIKVVVTAYASVPEETDDTPFITASGKYVADGIIANNMLPFGTKVRIPKLYGNKVFVVEDRMNVKKGNHQIDIWMPSKPLAVNFGVKTAQIEILEN